jgi:hypothetical protein
MNSVASFAAATSQYWAVFTGSSGTVTIRNLAFYRAGVSVVLTQDSANYVARRSPW